VPSERQTLGLGTTIYAAPEQKRNKDGSYDYRVDIYSLGIILFELFFPFNTFSEYSVNLENIKKRRMLPDNLTKRWPKLAELILQLTCESPVHRPSAIENILQLFSQVFSHTSD